MMMMMMLGIERSEQADLFDLNIYFTGEVQKDEIKNVMQREVDENAPGFFSRGRYSKY